MKKKALFILLAAAPVLFYVSLTKPLFRTPYSPVLLDRGGLFLSAKVAEDEQWRFLPDKTNAALNPKFSAALIEYEDRRFYTHPGVDPFAIVRAALSNIKAGRVVSGASTITMQTIRISRNSKRRNMAAKILEALLALRLEVGASKDEILRLYAANAPFGGNAVGLDAAVWRYFGHGASMLSWAEAASLAVLPNSPSLVHPGRSHQVLRQKRDALLKKLSGRGYFDLQTLELAIAEPLPESPNPIPQIAYHYLESEIQNSMSAITYSAIDIRLQSRANAILNRRSEFLQKQGIMNAACVVLDTKTGETLAYVGNVDSPLSPFVDMARARRSSGSLLKPFLYAAMLDSGELMPKELVRDVPTRFDSYNPQNNTRSYMGAVPANEALTHSLNVPAVIELRRFGVPRFMSVLRSFGISTLFRKPEEYGLPLILGGAEITLAEICRAYATLGQIALGEQIPYSQISPSISKAAAYITLETLTGVARPDEESSWRHFAGAHNIAWKTGTSFGLRDGWAIGINPRRTVGVWVGNASGEGRAGLSAAADAAPILFEIFSFLNASGDAASNWFEPPWNALTFVEVCAASGFPAGPNCAAIREDAVPKNAPRRVPCPYCRTLTLNEAGDRQVVLTAGTAERTRQQKWFVLPAAEEWYYKRVHLEYKPPPQSGTQNSPLTLFNPEPESQIYVPVELDGKAGKVVFRAAHRNDDAVLYWHIDDNYIGSTSRYHEFEARPQAGKHILTVVDDSGNIIRRRFFILNENR